MFFLHDVWYWRLKFTSRKDRFAAKLKGLRGFLKENLNTDDTMGTLERAASVIKGWVNYHNISDNYKRVHSFVHHAREIIFKWFNRKGGQFQAQSSAPFQVAAR